MSNQQMYLDTITPLSAYVGHGTLGLHGDLGYEGKRVMVAGRHDSHAISAHGPSSVQFALPAGVKALHCSVAINGDVDRGHGVDRHVHANFHVYADEAQVALASFVKPGEPPRALHADLSGARTVELRVTTTRWEYCHAVWLDPRLEVAAPPSQAGTLVECFGRAAVQLPPPSPSSRRCIATVVSPGYEALLDDMLQSLRANGGCPDARVVVLAVEPNAACEEVIARHGAAMIRCARLGRLDIGIKSLLYSVARIFDADAYICLDADMLVLSDLSSLFAAVEAAPLGSVLACREGNHLGAFTLGQAIEWVYKGSKTDLSRLYRGDVQRISQYPLAVNDGIFAGSREALLALDGVIREIPNAVEWIDERRQLCWWRNQFIFNLALAILDCGVPADDRFNIQLHVQDAVLRDSPDGVARAFFRGQAVRVLHFCGVGRRKLPDYRGRLRCD